MAQPLLTQFLRPANMAQMLQVLITAGGLAMMLFAIRFLRKGLDRLFGARLGTWMRHMAESRLRAFLTGLGVSILAPSSTTMAILAVQTVQDRRLSARQMFAVMLGADVGLTVMVILISLRLDAYAPLLLLVGVALFQFTRGQRSRGIGQVTLAIGFIFLGIGIIRGGAAGHEPSENFTALIDAAASFPVVLALIAALIALGTQSSTATIGMVMGLALADLVDTRIAVATVIGANVGIGVNALLVGWRQVESRRLGLANLSSKLIVAAAALALLPWVVDLLERLPGDVGVDKQTAAAHLGFNLVRAVVFLPLVDPVAALMARCVPARVAGEAPLFGPRYLGDAPRDSVTLALSMSLREVLRVSEIVRGMLDDVWQALRECDAALARRVKTRDDQVDTLDGQIKGFLVRLGSGEDGGRREAEEVMRQLRYLNELETIGDVIDKCLADAAIKRAERQIRFSDEGWRELDELYQKVRENVLIAENAFHSRDVELARQLLRHQEQITEQERLLRDRHFDRLRDGSPTTHESSAIHLELLTHLERINSCVTHVAHAILEDDQER